MGFCPQGKTSVFFLAAGFVLVFPAAGSAEESSGVTVRWGDGFRIEDKRDDSLYYLRLKFALQFRYTYLAFDPQTVSNADHDWNNFFLRRARLFADGMAPDKNWTYYLHVQLEPPGGVNLHDGYVQWERYRFCRVQFGRMKIPFSLEFWQSGFLLNGVERTIFSAETDVDGKTRDVLGNTIERFWPGGNAAFPTSGHYATSTTRNRTSSKGTLFPTGGLMLYRSQGIDVNGDVSVPGLNEESLLQYRLGLYNGRDTQGFGNPTDQLLSVFRLAYAPLGEFPLTMQGDFPCTQEPKVVVLFSVFRYGDEATRRYDLATDTYVNDKYDIRDWGYDLAAVFRWRGLSLDLEYGFENFDMEGRTPDNRDDYDRLGGRVNLGYFLVPKKWEAVFRYGYLERIHDNDSLASLRTGLGLVETRDGWAVEKNLQEYTFGVNYYLHGHNQKICMDYSLLVRAFRPAEPGSGPVEDQVDHRARVMFQQTF